MKRKISPTIVGIFVAGGLLLLAAAAISFGSGRLFHKPVRFVVILRQSSISGLEPGSSVKFSGVRVGRVEDVSARLDSTAGDVVVRIVCDIDERVAATLFAPPAPPREKMIERLVTSGMGAKINFSGVTGLQYLDLNVDPKQRVDSVAIDAEAGAPVVPAAQSDFAELTEMLTTILHNVSRFDFPGISTDLKTLLGNLNTSTKDLDLRGTLARIDSAVAAVEKTASDGNLREAMLRLNEAARGLRDFAAELSAGVPEVKADLHKTLAQATLAMKALADAAAEAQSLVGPEGGLGEEVGRTLQSLQHAAASAEQLIQYLERNPAALIRGRAPAQDSQAGAKP